VSKGAILLLGQDDAPRNYLANTYPFRPDSHFLYYVGTNLPGMATLLLADGSEVLLGPAEDPDDLVWHGPHPVLADHAREAGIGQTAEISTLAQTLSELRTKGEAVHYLSPYRADRALRLAELLGRSVAEVATGVSGELARAVVEQRSVKSEAEVAQIEEALGVTAWMYAAAMGMARPGITEAQVAGAMQGVALAHDRAQCFLPIVTIRGEVLHNNYYGNTLKDGDMLLVDSGAESPCFYASDITRTFPVSGRFSAEQKEIYQVVLNSQLAVIEAASPELTNKQLHLVAAKTIASGLTELGLMRGDPAEAVAQGAHALFFCHGIGHMLGLDVHDMEDLGDAVGYPKGEGRSAQFGLSFLRLAKKLKPGYVITDEPGVYFVPALIDRWAGEKKNEAFIDYEMVERFRHFGGVRIEDDLLITEKGCRVLGPPIAKTVVEIEEQMTR
jgi:Xaa-Pro aminopeptidase